MRKLLPGVHLEVARNWEALIQYCRKSESAVEGTQVQQKNHIEHWSLDMVFMNMARYSKEYEITFNELVIEQRQSVIKVIDGEFWYCVNRIVEAEPFRVSIFATPQVKTIWSKTRQTWKNMFDAKARADSITPAPEAPGTVIELASPMSVCR